MFSPAAESSQSSGSGDPWAGGTSARKVRWRWHLSLVLASAAALLLAARGPLWAQGHTATPGQIDQHNNAAQTYINFEFWGARGNLPRPKGITVSGVNIDIYYNPTDPKLAEREQAVKDAIALMVSQGFQFPPTVDIVLKPAVIGSPASKGRTYIGFYNPTTILTNLCNKVTPPDGSTRAPNSSVSSNWHDDIFKRERAFRWWEKCHVLAKKKAKHASCQATVIHEMCHILHQGQSQAEFYWSKGNLHSSDGGWAAQAAKVSVYAGRNRLEFVAEVCAGLALGYRYDAQVMQAYAQLGGPLANVPYQPAPAPTTVPLADGPFD